ncbi:MAG: hypothetical protein ABIV21_09045 [Pyrinomonadaceae bacterium]
MKRATHKSADRQRMAINSIKLFSMFIVIAIVAIVWSGPAIVLSNANTDALEDEIAGYKSWTRMNIQPIKSLTELTIDGDSGSG